MTGSIQFSKMTDIIKTLLSDNKHEQSQFLTLINGDDFMKQWMSEEVKTAVEALFLKPKAKTKAKKDPSKPKRARNAYIYFGMKIRAKVKDDNPDMNSKEITKELGRLWKECDDKSEYVEQAEQDKVRFEEEMKTHTTEGEETTKTDSKTSKDPSKPKGVRTAYNFFCKAMRPQVKEGNPGMNSKEITKELGRLWKECDDRTEYEALNTEDKERHAKEMEEYESMSDSDDESDDDSDDDSVEYTDEKDTELFEEFVKYQTEEGYKPQYDNDKRLRSLKKRWGKMTVVDKLTYE